MDVDKRRSVMEAFTSLYFNYCLLVWRFRDRGHNKKINWMHERSLRIVHGDNKTSFKKLFWKDKSVKMHHINLQVLATEIYKIKHGLSPQIINNVFELIVCLIKWEDRIFIPISKCTFPALWKRYFDLSWTKDMGYCIRSNQK